MSNVVMTMRMMVIVIGMIVPVITVAMDGARVMKSMMTGGVLNVVFIDLMWTVFVIMHTVIFKSRKSGYCRRYKVVAWGYCCTRSH